MKNNKQIISALNKNCWRIYVNSFCFCL